MLDKQVSLYEAILLLKTPEECEGFLKDLLTPREQRTIQDRWKVCQMLSTKHLTYQHIGEITKISLQTIVRVARVLRTEPNKGYKLILNRIKQKE